MSVALFNIKNNDSMTLCNNANKSYTWKISNMRRESKLGSIIPNGKLERPQFLKILFYMQGNLPKRIIKPFFSVLSNNVDRKNV
jgi:hypothetical protein